MKRIAVFFDTNVIESRFSHEKHEFLFHEEIKPNSLFYQIKNCIRDNGIVDIVDLCIPDLSWREFKLHLLENYRERRRYISLQKELYRKAFGSTFGINYEFKHETEEQYKEHFETLASEFLSQNKCKLVSYPKEVEFFECLVEKCLNKQPPFQLARNNRKEYSDAGLKDALIVDTIIRYASEHDCFCILISNDYDFRDIKDVRTCKTVDEFSAFLEEQSYVVNTSTVQNKLENDEYLKDTIITSTGNIYDESVTEFYVVDITDEGSWYVVRIRCVINEVIYLIECKYEPHSNELLDITYKKENE